MNERKGTASMPISLDLMDSKRGNEEEGVPELLNLPRESSAVEAKSLRDEIRRVQQTLEHKMKEKVDKRDLEEIKGIIRQFLALFYFLANMLKFIDEELQQKTKRFVDKQDLKMYKTYLEKQLENLFTLIQTRIPTVPEGDSAMLSKKPLGGWSCASCEKNLTNIMSQSQDHQSWNRLPMREPNIKLAKAGQGFSKILSKMKPGELNIGSSRIGEDDSQLITQSLNISPNTRDINGNIGNMMQKYNSNVVQYQSASRIATTSMFANFQQQQQQQQQEIEIIDGEIQGQATMIHNRSVSQLPKINQKMSKQRKQ
ncbi:UNKNOWN [Stylonychia lemnae]|uniref:Uncharacterized protein n=1 Tax=Stylonychia lemnae TaxID=5949 RepID=A0A078B625_STYLE|nr:UNKNOWN [Stylonychia lemnae]|eukprot:CDW89676.1 UNKNOWN [Stylonychia lemnae]